MWPSGLFSSGQFLLFSNWILLVYWLAAVWLFHRQVLREEEFLKQHYGQEYSEYSAQSAADIFRPAGRRNPPPSTLRSSPSSWVTSQELLMASVILPANPSESRPGRFGVYGGRYVPETLMAALVELEHEYEIAKADAAFQAELTSLLTDYAGRPTPLYFAKRLTETLGGAKIYLKREDLLHTGAHKINNALGQGLLAKRMGKKRVIAETGAGQHGVATATVCALLGLECVVYMGEVDMERQDLNVKRMRLLGAEVRGVSSGSKTLKDAISEAMRDWVTNVRDHLLPAGQRSRRASVPDHGARLPSRHQHRNEARKSWKKKAGCPRP